MDNIQKFFILVFMFLFILGCQQQPQFSSSVQVNPNNQSQVVPKPTTPLERLNNLNSQVRTCTADVQMIIRKRPVVITLNGKLSYGKEKYFRLVNYDSKKGFASDIGSNDEYFWIYAKRIDRNKMYYCPYSQLDQVEIDNSLNPMWMLEALGLGQINTSLSQKKESGRIILYEKRTGIMNVPVWKATVIDTTKPAVVLHYLYDSEKQIIATVQILDFYKYGELYVPKSAEFYWAKENATAQITFRNWKFNKQILASAWQMPNIGVKVVNMAEQKEIRSSRR